MFFFLSIGLLLDIQYLWNNLDNVLGLLVIITVGKTLLNVGILHALKLPWSQAFMISALIAQLGEFAFLLSTVAREAEVISSDGEKLIISLTVLSLAISPIWLLFARYLKNIADTTNRLSIRRYFKSILFGTRKILGITEEGMRSIGGDLNSSDTSAETSKSNQRNSRTKKSKLDENPS